MTDARSALERLTLWRDVGDGPVCYTAGNEAFAADVSALLSTVGQMSEALSKPGKLVYLDGRTEDAAHVVPFPMQTAEIDTDRDLTESAEAIYDEAAKLGYGDGCAVWCEFSHFPGQYGDYGMCEIAPGYEFVGIDPLLTEMFGGRPTAEDAAPQEDKP